MIVETVRYARVARKMLEIVALSAYSFGQVFLCMIVKRKYLQRYLRVAQENLTFETSELKM